MENCTYQRIKKMKMGIFVIFPFGLLMLLFYLLDIIQKGKFINLIFWVPIFGGYVFYNINLTLKVMNQINNTFEKFSIADDVFVGSTYRIFWKKSKTCEFKSYVIYDNTSSNSLLIGVQLIC